VKSDLSANSSWVNPSFNLNDLIFSPISITISLLKILNQKYYNIKAYKTKQKVKNILLNFRKKILSKLIESIS
ncbi:MAG: hypothetical protein KHW44_09965, partial [Finegoldia magna]